MTGRMHIHKFQLGQLGTSHQGALDPKTSRMISIHASAPEPVEPLHDEFWRQNKNQLQYNGL
jgi:hypothetical protein